MVSSQKLPTFTSLSTEPGTQIRYEPGTESQIEHRILLMLNSMRVDDKRLGLFWKNVSTGFHDGKGWRKQASPFAINGVPDIMGCTKLGLMMLEVKTAKGRLSEDQINFSKAIQPYGQRVHVVRSCRDALVALKSQGFDVLELYRAAATDLVLTCEDLAFLRNALSECQEFLKIDLKTL